MEKTDLTKLYKAYYKAANTPELVVIEAAHYLAITGEGDPSGENFAADLQALYATAYAVKFFYKALNKDFVVARLEGSWGFNEEEYPGISMQEAPRKIPRSHWQYQLMIRLPEFANRRTTGTIIEQVVLKKQLVRAKKISLISKPAGRAVQMLHTGPFDREPESLRQMQDFIEARCLQRDGLHHEIYLSDFRRTAPDKLRTILREPVK